jgi:hypothetical protein
MQEVSEQWSWLKRQRLAGIDHGAATPEHGLILLCVTSLIEMLHRTRKLLHDPFSGAHIRTVASLSGAASWTFPP